MAQEEAMLGDLNPGQRAVVQHQQGPLLVLAGPGSGKTQALIYRVAYLIAERGVQPENILAVTFTNKAAEEMRTRLEKLLGRQPEGMWIHTFHAACLRLLREHGDALGLARHFVVFDQSDQDDLIIHALNRLQWSRYVTDGELNEIRDFLGRRKAALIDPAYDPERDRRESALAQIGEMYQEMLRAYNALDFDDLIAYAVRLLHQEDEVRAAVQDRFRHVLVDEYHDINPAQYAFIQHVAPPPGSNIVVVADDNQSIYRWRGAEPKLIRRFRRDYRPTRANLGHNYRSTGHILKTAQHFLRGSKTSFLRAMTAERSPGEKVHHHIFQTVADESAWLVTAIEEWVKSGRYRYEDVAVLYRLHWLGDSLEQALGEAGIPLNRVQRESFFEQDGVREMVRYLELLHSFADPHLRVALNFPRVMADELTMLQLQGLADRSDLSLAELARHLDDYPEVSPLTRAAVRRFIRTMEQDLLPIAERDLSEIVARLFAVLEPRRSPYRQEEMETLRGFAHFLTLDEEVAHLRAALDAGREIAILAAPNIDAMCGAVILEHTLLDYLGAKVSLQIVRQIVRETGQAGERPVVPQGAFILALGTTLEGESEGKDVLSLTARDVKTIRYSLSTVAWRLGQGLLVSYEILDEARFVVYDVETTGVRTERDEIVEIAALTLDRRLEVGEPFHSLVRPRRGYIPDAATKVHGIAWEEVRDAPAIDDVLPGFLRYVGDAILAGHNVEKFDNVLVNREMKRILKRRLINHSLDTLKLARRLLPHRRHTLEALVEHFELEGEVAHRALPDVRHERDLLLVLLDENRWQKELEALTEILPLVALGMEAAAVPLADENRSLYLAAGRVARQEDDPPYLKRLLDLLPDDGWWEASRRFAELQSMELPDTLEDIHWAELRRNWDNQLRAFAEVSEALSLEAFLGYTALAAPEDEPAPQAEGVTLMTLHNSKGKEFAVVIVVGLEEGVLPFWRSLDDEEDLEEERRVFYVGMTRAKDVLHITTTLDRGRKRSMSRFARELSREVVVTMHQKGLR